MAKKFDDEAGLRKKVAQMILDGKLEIELDDTDQVVFNTNYYEVGDDEYSMEFDPDNDDDDEDSENEDADDEDEG